MTAIVLLALFYSCGLKKTLTLLSKAEVHFTGETSTSHNYHKSNSLIILEVNVHHKVFRFIFDTGAGTTVVSEEFAKSLNLDEVGHISVEDALRKERTLPVSIIDTLSLELTKFSNVGVVVTDINSNPSIACLNIDGILGMNVIQNGNWVIDFNNSTISCSMFGNNLNLPSRDHEKVSFHVNNQKIPFIEISCDSIKSKFMLDTGKSGDVISASNTIDLKETIGVLVGNRATGLFNSSNSKDTSTYKRVHSFENREFKFSNLIIYQSEKEKSLIGNGFLEKNYSAIAFDFENSLFYFKRRSFTSPTSISYGINPSVQNQVITIGAKHVGFSQTVDKLEIGDTIVEINNIPISTNPCLFLQEYSGAKDDAKPIFLRIIKNGLSQRVMLEPKKL